MWAAHPRARSRERENGTVDVVPATCGSPRRHRAGACHADRPVTDSASASPSATAAGRADDDEGGDEPCAPSDRRPRLHHPLLQGGADGGRALAGLAAHVHHAVPGGQTRRLHRSRSGRLPGPGVEPFPASCLTSVLFGAVAPGVLQAVRAVHAQSRGRVVSVPPPADEVADDDVVEARLAVGGAGP